MKMKNIVILVSGNGTNLQVILDSLAAGTLTGCRAVGVISNRSDAYALERAMKAGVPTFVLSPKQFETREDFTAAMLRKLDELRADILVLAGYLVIMPLEIVTKYENRIVNVHPSLLPAFGGKGNYGIKIHENVLSRGVKITGATVHLLDGGTDTGPIILQKAVLVHETDTPQTLQKRVMEEAEYVLLPRAIQLMADDRLHVENGRVRCKQG